MTRKDYVMLAACIKAELEYNASDNVYNVLVSLTNRITPKLMNDNPNFNLTKFERACGF